MNLYTLKIQKRMLGMNPMPSKSRSQKSGAFRSIQKDISTQRQRGYKCHNFKFRQSAWTLHIQQQEPKNPYDYAEPLYFDPRIKQHKYYQPDPSYKFTRTLFRIYQKNPAWLQYLYKNPIKIYIIYNQHLHQNSPMIQSLKQFITTIDPNSDTTQLLTTQQIITELDYIQGEHSKKMANSIGTLIQIIDNHILQLPYQQKYSFVDLIVLSLQVCPSVLRKNPSRVQKLFFMICKVMANINEIIPDIWYQPPPEYNQDDIDKLLELDPDTALICRFRSFVDRIGSIIGFQKMIGIIQGKALSLYKDQHDWRWKYAVLMCLSQLSQDVDLNKINNIVLLIKQGSNHTNPKVRYSAIQVLGQFSDDLKPGFQERYFHEFMQIIIKGFEDNVERVAAHWMACMTNFIEDYTNTPEVFPYVPALIAKICYFIQHGNSSSKQNAVATLASLVTVPSLFDTTTINKPFQICHSIFQTFSVQKYKQLINQTFQCITITLSNQPFTLVKQYLPFTIDLCSQICDKIQGEYLVTGWHRLCGLEYRFQGWMPIFRRILQVVGGMPLDQMKSGLNSILSTVQCFKQDFYPLSLQSLQFIKQIFTNALTQNHEQTSIAAIQCISQIMSVAKPANPDQNWDFGVRDAIIMYSGKVIDIIDNGLYSVAEKVLDSIKELFKGYVHLFSQGELKAHYDFFMDVVGKLSSKKSQLLNDMQQLEQQLDQDLAKQKKQSDEQGINNCLLCIPDIIQILLKTTTNKNNLITSILSHVQTTINNSIDEQDQRYATYYIDNLLEDYDYSVLNGYWVSMYNYLVEFSVKEGATLRNSAIFGLGVLMEKSPFEIVTMETIGAWVQVVKKAWSMPQLEKETKKVYGHCQDNCVAVIGKLLHRYKKVFDLKFLYDKWLLALPLKYDHEENRQQIRNLCEMLIKEPEVLIDNSNEGKQRLLRVFKIFGELICNIRKKKASAQNEKVLVEVKQVLNLMGNWPIYKQNEAAVMNVLSKNQQYQMTAFLTGLVELLSNELMMVFNQKYLFQYTFELSILIIERA